MHEPQNNIKNPAIKLTFSAHISRMPPFARNSSVSRFALIYVIIVNYSIHLHTLFKKTSRQFNFIPGLKLPLFDGGRLNANLEGTRAASNMMIERYNQSVLNAVRDVAVNGTRLQTLNDEREMQAERVEATRFTQRAAEAAYQRGLTSRLQATEARLPVLAEEMSLLMLDSRRVIQSIQLMKSLGGGYQAGPVVEKK